MASSKNSSTPPALSEMTNTDDGSASSTEEKLVISANFADKLFHASHKRTCSVGLQLEILKFPLRI